MRALGLDVGGTKLAAAVVADNGDILGRHQVRTPVGDDAAAVFDALCAAADGAVAAAGDAPAAVPSRASAGSRGVTRAGLAGIGIATAGPLDTVAGTVSPVNIGAWRDFPLRDRLVARYGLDVRMFGDAIAMVIAEHWLGAARGVDNVLGMVVSTGVGGGLIQGGRVVFGAGGNAGHIGHISVDPAGPPCVCGGVGCLEAIASGTSIARWYGQRRAAGSGPASGATGGLGAGNPAAGGVGSEATAADIARAARAGDELALAAFRRSAGAIGLGVASAVTLLDLQRVVIGGGVANAFDLLAGPLSESYARYAGLGFAHGPRVMRAELGEDVGVLGAAAVVLHPDRYWSPAS
jgi:glucokinase